MKRPAFRRLTSSLAVLLIGFLLAANARAAGACAHQAGAIRHIESWDRWTASDRLTQVQTPTLIICGVRDRSPHLDGKIRVCGAIPNAQLFVAPDAGHIVHLEQPEVFNATVERFLRSS